MTGGTRGWIAVGVLVALLLGAGAALSRSEPGRIRYLAWRAGSSDPAVRRRAVSELLAIGRPAIDPVLADVFAREVRDRSSGNTRLAVVQRDPMNEASDLCDGHLLTQYHDDEVGTIAGGMEKPDPAALAFERLVGSRRVALLDHAGWWVVRVSCPLDDGTEGRLMKLFPELKKP
jgi:hypothetical protein